MRLAGASAILAHLAFLAIGSPALALEVTAVSAGPVESGQSLELSVSVSEAVGEVSVAWSFGDGEVAAAAPGATQITHTYQSAGHYSVIATVKDQNETRGASFLQTVHRPLTPVMPTQSTPIVYDPTTQRVYVVNPDNDSIGMLDGESLTLIAEIETFVKPTTLALAPNGRLWVAHQDDYAIAIVDPDERAMVGAISLPYASQPTGLVFSPRGDAVYVALRAVGKIVRIDPNTRRIVETLEVGRSPHALAVTHDGERVFATRFLSPKDHGEVFEFSRPATSVERTFELPADPGPDTDTSGRGIPNFVAAIAISPDGESAWVGAKKDNTGRGLFVDGAVSSPENTVRSMIARLDLEQNVEQLAGRIDVDNRNLPAAICFSSIGDYAFVATQGNDLVVVIDAYTTSTVAAIDRTGKAPQGLALSPDGKLFVQAFLSRSVSVFDVTAILAARDYASPPKLAEIPSIEHEVLADDVLVGKRIFYDSADVRMSREGYLSCASCHLEGLEDGRVWDFTSRGEGLRNTTTLGGKRGIGQGRLHWTANFDEVQDFEHDIRNAFGGTGFMSDADFHTGTRDQTLGEKKAGVSVELDALSAYVSSLDDVHRSPFKSEDGLMTAAALAGREHFVNLGCDECHSGPDFTDSASGLLHDVGTITAASGKRLDAVLTGFDTPTLIGVWETAPYLHDGSAETLRDVFRARNPNDLHGATSTLDDAELGELEAYLRELDGDPAPRTLPEFPEEPSETEASGGCALARVDAPAPIELVACLGMSLFALARRRNGKAR